MQYFLSSLLLGLLFNIACAQDNAASITGTVADERGNAVPYANVAVYHAGDSLLVTGAVSDETGAFTIPIARGKYYVLISFLSYQDISIPLVLNTTTDLGKVVLKTRYRELEEVVITGERSQMELRLDKRVFNVDKDLSNVGGSAADILGNLPSINVDAEGVVSLRGSENVRILINGRPSGLTSRDPDALRKLQGSLVERVEVITNPSSRYDAEGEVGIINIILKKNENKGINGAITAGIGDPAFYQGSYSINVRKKDINFFSSYGVDKRTRIGSGSSFQRFKQGDSSYVQNNDRNGWELSHNLVAGADYYFNDKNILTGSLNYNISDGVNLSNRRYDDLKSGIPARTILRTEREAEDEKNVEGNINFKRDFNKDGKSWTLDLQYIQSVDNETSDYTEGLDGAVPQIQKAINFADETSWLIQSDFVNPINDHGKLELGFKSATRIINNEFQFERQDESGSFIADPAFTNHLAYKEHVHAAYFMGSNTFSKLSAQAGFRAELTDIETRLIATNDINTQNYFNVFPSTALSYALKENKTLQLSYSYRISRPGFRSLMPFSNFSDSRVFFAGNPALRPEYTHSIEAGYLLDWKNGSILSSIYHRNRRNVIERVVSDPDDQGRTVIVPVNLAKEKAHGLEFNVSLSAGNWWSLNSSANFYRAMTSGFYEGEPLGSDTYTMSTRTTSQFTIAKTWSFQTSINYRAPRATPQGEARSFYSVDLGLSRDLFKGKATIAASVRDLFNTRRRRSIVDTDVYYSRSDFQWQRRQVRLTFVYRINREKEKDEERRSDDSDLNNNDD